MPSRADRPWRPTARVCCRVAAAVVLVFGMTSCAAQRPAPAEVDAETLLAWQLPADLPGWLAPVDEADGAGIERLELAGPIDRADWLAGSTLKHLSLRGSAVSDLGQLPPTLESLDLCNTLVTELPPLPRGLRELDLRYVPVKRLAGLPSSLRRLSLAGTSLPEADLGHSNVRILELERTAPNDGEGDLVLPPHLGTLALRAIGLGKIPPDLPKSLGALALETTGIEVVQGLGDGLSRLALRTNRFLDRIDWPPRLRELQLDSLERRALTSVPDYLEKLVLWNTPDLDLEPYRDQLVSLELKSVDAVEWPSEDQARPLRLRALRLIDSQGPPSLPGTLEVVDLGGSVGVRLAQLEELKPVLRRLTLRLGPDEGSELTSLDLSGQEGLEELELSSDWPVSVDGLPATLERLTLRIARIEALPELPDGLRELDLTGSGGVAALPLRLPEGLTDLVLRDTGVATLPALPAGLETLDVSGTKVADLAQSLSGLEHLHSLVVSLGDLSSLAGLPRSITSLGFRSRSPLVPCPMSLLEELGW